MTAEHRPPQPEAPRENFARGLYQVDIPELGAAKRGKVRDMWRVEKDGEMYRVLVTTDRQSAYDRIIGTVPGKGQVLNLTSAFWFENTRDIIQNHMVAVPHPNVLIAREAVETLPVEIVLRDYMAQSGSSTSIYHNYAERGRDTIYGIDFPKGLRANEKFPMGTIITPTTKAESGHDEELTDKEAGELVDTQNGPGIWGEAKKAARALFKRASEYSRAHGLILVDTKYEFGLDKNKQLMLIDEIHTPDSSRYWLSGSYEELFARGAKPENFDKEILRDWLKNHGFRGDGEVPVIDAEIIQKMSEIYRKPYEMLTGKQLPPTFQDSNKVLSRSIARAVLPYIV